MRTIFLSIFLILFAITVCAQQRPPSNPPPPPDNEEAAPPPPREREDVRFFLAYKMKERLGLTEAQTLKVLDILKEGDDFRLAHRAKMKNLRQAAQTLLNDPKASDADFKKFVTDMDALKKENETKMEEVEKKLLSAFTPRQQLEWVLFKRELQRGTGSPDEREGQGPPPGGGRGRPNH
jgi:Spy/CpxP family protein refolding chaperone